MEGPSIFFFTPLSHKSCATMSRKATATHEETPMPQPEDDSAIDLSADIINIEELQNHGINMSDIVKLKSAGIHSISVGKY